MADFRLQGLLEFQTSAAVQNVKKFSKELEAQGQNLRTVGSDMQTFSGIIAQAGAVFSGTITAAVVKARAELPVIDGLLKDIGNSFQSMSNSVAEAALPTVTEFSETMEGLAGVVSGFARRHGEVINQFLRYGAIAVAVAGFTFALGGLLRVIGLIVTISTKLGIVTALLNPIFLTVALAVGGLAAALYLLTKIFPGLGSAMNLFFQNLSTGILRVTGLDQVMRKFQKLFEEMQADFKNGAQRTLDVFGEFARGFRGNINTINENIRQFASSVSQSLDSVFGDAIFDAITGRIEGLRAFVLRFANDVGRALSRLAANELLALLFGDSSGARDGIFGGLFSIFRRRGSGGGATTNNTQNIQINNFGRQVDRTADKFRGLQQNMDLFAQAKDRVIDKLNELRAGFSRTFNSTGGPGGSGAVGLGASIAGAFTLSDDDQESLNFLQESLGAVTGLVTGIKGGFEGVQKEMVKTALVHAATTVAMLAVSSGAASVAVSVGSSAAAALTAAWAPAAISASIATFGAAAAAGLAAYLGAVGTGTATASGLSSSGGGQFSGPNFSVGNIGGIEGFGAEGAIVSRPTVALIGEAGPEALVPLNKTRGNKALPGGGMGSNVTIQIDKAVLNDPSDMDRFMRRLKEMLGRG